MSLAKVNDLKSRVGDIERKLQIAKSELDSAIQEHLQEKHQIKPGDRIFYKRRGVDVECEFSHFENDLTLPWAYVRKIKKDGTPAASVMCIYTDWRKP